MTPIRVLVIDDSASARDALSSILRADPAMAVTVAADPFVAARLIREAAPHVITLAAAMSRRQGLTFLRELMAQRPLPVVMCASALEDRAEELFVALEAGAVDVILLPRVDAIAQREERHAHIRTTVKGAARARPLLRPSSVASPRRLPAEALPPPSRAAGPVVCVGAATGGTGALIEVIAALPAEAPATVVVQHLPEPITRALARRLDSLAAVEVREASDGDELARGRVLIAPGGTRHALLGRRGARYVVQLRDGPLVASRRPSVDVLFCSAARAAGANAVGILLTGMGDDGARGLLDLRRAGARTIAQDEETSVVFGMAREAIAHGAADRVVPLGRIARELLQAGARQ